MNASEFLSETEFYDDLARIEVPVLVMHGEDDQILSVSDDRCAIGQTVETRNA